MANSKTSPITWAIPDVEKYYIDGQLAVPTYQRGIVWNYDKQQALMLSVFRGLPIGSLLVWQTISAGKVQYQLVDGLQRTTTILEFLKAPLKYVQVGLLEQSKIDGLLEKFRSRTGLDINQDQLKAEIRAWVSTLNGTSAQEGFESFRLADRILQAFEQSPSLETIKDLLAPCSSILDAIRQQIAIEDYKIPVVVYEGSEEELPGIFERINTTGLPLSKYQKFAASWTSRDTIITSQPVKAAVRDKYKQLEEHGFVVVEFDPEDQNYRYDLFEYLFGLGKFLASEHKALLSQTEDVTDVESASFSVATVAHGLRLNKMSHLPGEFARVNRQLGAPGYCGSEVQGR